ncbi:hypothetical protein ECDEC8E_2218 [Escherichia coli DEC8E]|nr:hypothetical protein ECDEC8E_2218 [Escherichia coli DEC8E]
MSLRHRSGNAIYPLKRGLFPRHLRAEKTRFFVHVRILDGSSHHAGRKYKKSFKKIVQTCALSCKQKKTPYRRFKNINCCCVLIANHEHMLHKHLCALQFQPG